MSGKIVHNPPPPHRCRPGQTFDEKGNARNVDDLNGGAIWLCDCGNYYRKETSYSGWDWISAKKARKLMRPSKVEM